MTIELQGWIIDGYRVTGRNYTQAKLTAQALAKAGAPRDVAPSSTLEVSPADRVILEAALLEYRYRILCGETACSPAAKPDGGRHTLKTAFASCSALLELLAGKKDPRGPAEECA